MQKIFDTLGPPRNYGRSIQEVEEEERRKTEAKVKRQEQEKAEEERREEEEAQHRAARWEEWVCTGKRRSKFGDLCWTDMTQDLFESTG